jgi:predicted nucleic acid-binding protein
MILTDTNVFIELFRGNSIVLAEMEGIGFSNISASDVTLMELFVGAKDKKELSRLKRDMKPFRTEAIDYDISSLAVELIGKYARSHGLDIPDAFIAATSLVQSVELFTYNVKDFQFIPGIKLYQPIH